MGKYTKIKSYAINEDEYRQAKNNEELIKNFREELNRGDKVYVDGKKYIVLEKHNQFATVRGENYETSFLYEDLYRGETIG